MKPNIYIQIWIIQHIEYVLRNQPIQVQIYIYVFLDEGPGVTRGIKQSNFEKKLKVFSVYVTPRVPRVPSKHFS